MEEDRISYHESVLKAYERIKMDKMSNVWDRYAAQGIGDNPGNRCQFCMTGRRCDLCSNGPCRADAAIDKRGVCGITADGMAMRMMLLRNVMGASTYQYHAEQTIKTLRSSADGKSPFKIREPQKLISLSERLGIDVSGRPEEIALRLCDFVDEDFNRKADEPSRIVEMLAPEERKNSGKNWGYKIWIEQNQ